MVSRLVKRGMPTDTLERAQKWRKRHLEAGRVKGSRFNPSSVKPANLPRAVQCIPVADIEALGVLLDGAETSGNSYSVAIHVFQVRNLLRKTPTGASPRLSLRVWLKLLDYMLAKDSEIRHAPDLGALLTPDEFGRRVCPAGWDANTVLDEACDFDDISINGWPDYPDREV